jgi:hypothetical protein
LDFEKAVVEFGTEAVLRYRTIAEARHDNELPESFLRGFVAMRLHERFGCQVHVERLYTAMALASRALGLRQPLAGRERKRRVLRLARAAFGYEGVGKHPVVPVQHERYRSWRIA